jgi:hypothetical protein
MWVATPIGFFSAVKQHGDGGVTVRARVKSDLESLLECYLPGEDLPLVRKDQADYEWRVFMTHEQWATCMWYASFDVNYHNFKDEVTKTQGRERHDVYLRVWTALRNGLEQISKRPKPGQLFWDEDDTLINRFKRGTKR